MNQPAASGSRVVLTDHPWPDIEIEQSILSTAGFKLAAGPTTAGSAESIEAMVAAHDPVAIMTCWAQVSAKAISIPADLRIVARLGVGLDNIDVAAATARGAWVANVPDYSVEEVSDHAIAMLLSAWRGITAFDRESKLGRWDPGSANLRRTRDRVVGILGYGHIGRATARKLSEGFRCEVMVYSPSLVAKGPHEIAARIHAVDLETILERADAIILHLPLVSSTRHLVDGKFLERCKRKPWLINVSRGGLVDTQALLRALEIKQIAGAGLDVIEGEPSPPAELMSRSDLIVTPHIAFSSDASVHELRVRCTEEVVRVLRGERPHHPCNIPVE